MPNLHTAIEALIHTAWAILTIVLPLTAATILAALFFRGTR